MQKSSKQHARAMGNVRTAMTPIRSNASGNYSATNSPQKATEQFQKQKIGSGEVIKDVWKYNFKQVMKQIRLIIPKYQYIAMDTEFPGIVARPIGNFSSSSGYHYQSLRVNVDNLKLIQLGISLCDENGNTPIEGGTWQFNFCFDVDQDMYAQESIDLLTKSGLDFKRFKQEGIDTEEFAELLLTSGLVLLDDVKWLSFHSGYDFAYLIKIMTQKPLPADDTKFFQLLKIFFPYALDIKYLLKSQSSGALKGLQDIADELNIKRIGSQHQAGSDSLLTLQIYLEIKKKYFDGFIGQDKFAGNLYGLGQSHLDLLVAPYSGSFKGSLGSNKLKEAENNE